MIKDNWNQFSNRISSIEFKLFLGLNIIVTKYLKKLFCIYIRVQIINNIFDIFVELANSNRKNHLPNNIHQSNEDPMITCLLKIHFFKEWG